MTFKGSSIFLAVPLYYFKHELIFLKKLRIKFCDLEKCFFFETMPIDFFLKTHFQLDVIIFFMM